MDLETWAGGKAREMPLELFCFAGGFVEELVAPIPSALIMITAGTIAGERALGTAAVGWLALLGAAGKTAGAAVIYAAAGRAENFFKSRFARFLGIGRREADRMNSGWKSGTMIFVLRAIPVVPGVILSVAGGLLKVRPKTFLLMTFCGYALKDFVLLYMGYGGREVYEALSAKFGGTGWIKAVFFIVLLFFGIRYWRGRQKTGGGGETA